MEKKTYKHLVQEYQRRMEELGDENACFESALTVSWKIMREYTYGERVKQHFWREFDKFWHENRPSDLG